MKPDFSKIEYRLPKPRPDASQPGDTAVWNTAERIAVKPR